MVFSSVPVFLDTPNWQQQLQNHHQQGSNPSSNISHEVLPHPQFPPLPPTTNPSYHAVTGGSARPGGSMAERARLAKIPQPEGTQKCPRCESTNTKFCYFNNYSLSQPRHFCKTCRRYWTRGGAMRNVPVGGGCRRNKKGKNGNSKSSNDQNKKVMTGSSSNTTSSTSTESIINIGQLQQQTNHQFPFLASLQNLSQFGNLGLNLSTISNNNQAQIGLSSVANNATNLINDTGFLQVGTGASSSGLSSNNENNILTSLVSQFALFDPASTGLYPFQSHGNIGNNFGASSSSPSTATRVSHMAPVKLEESHLLNLSRPISGLASSENNNQYWGASDFSGLNSYSTNNHLL